MQISVAFISLCLIFASTHATPVAPSSAVSPQTSAGVVVAPVLRRADATPPPAASAVALDALKDPKDPNAGAPPLPGAKPEDKLGDKKAGDKPDGGDKTDGDKKAGKPDDKKLTDGKPDAMVSHLPSF